MLVVLDHHRTAEMELFGLSSGSNCGLIRFDMTKSGARLAWDYFFRDEPIPWLVSYVEDRDLWSWKLPMSKEVSAAIASYPKDFALWEKWGQQKEIPWELVTEGAAILRYQQQQIDNACKNAVEITLDGHRVLCVNSAMLISEIAGKLAIGRPFGATFFIRSDGKKVWSLRSDQDSVDVSEVARRRGGGGHFHAAGFTE